MILSRLQSSYNAGIKSLAILLDPDKTDGKQCADLLQICDEEDVDYLLVGGSLITNTDHSQVIQDIKALSSIPLIQFPGSSMYLDHSVDAVLFLSLISQPTKGKSYELLALRSSGSWSVPILWSSWLSFNRWNLLTPKPRFSGWERRQTRV